MLNAGFQYLEQRDANDTITKDGVVGKNSPFATSDNSGIYDIIAEDLRWLKENVDDVKDMSDLEAIKQSVTDMYNEMKNDSSFGEAAAKAQAEEAKKQAQAALESATNAKTYRDDVVTKSTEANETLAEIKKYIDKAEKLTESNKKLEQSFSDYVTMASNKAKIASDSATNAATSETNAKTSETAAKASEDKVKTSETNAAQSESNAKAHMDATALSETNAKTSETHAKTSETNSKTSEVNAKASETKAKTSETNASNSADLSKAWAVSKNSPDTMNDTDSTTGKTQSSKSWAIYSKDRAISAFKSETNAKASETAAKTSETNAKTSETNASSSASNAATSESHAKISETNAATSASNASASEMNAKTSETNAKASEVNAMTSETKAKQSYVDSSNSADLAKKWAESSESPDSLGDTDSTTGKTQSSKSWAIYSRDRAINAYSSESNAKTSETKAKTSESNAATSEANASASASNAKTSETNAKASEVAAKTSEDNAKTSKSSAVTSETNAKSYMDTAKGYMTKAQEAFASAQAIQSIVDTAKANAEKCLADVEAVRDSLAKMITYQGSVDNYSDLPTSPQVGYSYNIKNADKEHGVNAGDNVVWNGTDWDNFGGAIDMSLFAELGKDVKFNTVTATTFTGNLDGIATKATADGKGSNIADTYVKKSGSTMISNLAFWDGAGICSENGKYAVSLANSGMSMDVVGGDGHIGFRGLSSETYIDTATGSYHGNVVGNADTATNATADKYGTDIADNYVRKYVNVGENDLNNIRYGGLYSNPLNAAATSARHYPKNEAGSLLVLNNGANGVDGCTQIYATYSSHNSYKREYDVETKTWSAWRKYAFEDSTVANAVNATNADTVDGVHAGSMFYNKGNWAADNWATIGTYQVNGQQLGDNWYQWGQVISSSTNDARFQLYASDNYGGDGRLHYRTGWDSHKNQWNTILDSENYNKFVPKLIKGIIMAFSGTFENGYPVNPDTNTGDAGWHICDGTNGTPDLRGKFILGASDSHAAGSAGGEESHVLTVNEMPAHSHTGTTSTNGAHSHSVTEVYFSRDDDQKGIKLDYADNTRTLNTSTDGDHNHTFTTKNSGSGAAHNNMPPYYTLSYIMKV